MQLRLTYLVLVVPPAEDLPADFVQAVEALAHERGADYALIRMEPNSLLLMHQPGGRLSFHSGIATLREKLLGVSMRHIVIRGKRGLQDMSRLFPGGLGDDQYIAWTGDTFEPDSFRRQMGTDNRLMDTSIKLRDLVNSREIDIMDVGSIATARAHIEQEDKDSTLEHRPLLEGPITVRYKKFVNGVWNGQYRDLVITGYPYDLLTKKKHWHIYSAPGMSKTTTTRLEIVNVYKGAFVQHPRNATNIPRNAQILVVDEVGHERKIGMEELKALTSGDASVAFLNRKFFGQSFVPLPHTQFIFLSNHSLYSIYAKHVKGRGMVISSTDLQALDERFHMIRLDGSDLEERLEYAHPKDLTRHQFQEKLYTILYYRNRTINAANQLCKKAVRDDLQKCYHLWLDRNAHKKQNLTTGLWLIFLQSLVHPADYPIFEEVHRDYSYYAGYQYNTPMVGNTIVHLPACRPPDGYVPPRDPEYVPPPPPHVPQEDPQQPETISGPNPNDHHQPPAPALFRPWCDTPRPMHPPSPVPSTSRAMHPPSPMPSTSRAMHPPSPVPSTSRAMHPPSPVPSTSRAMHPPPCRPVHRPPLPAHIPNPVRRPHIAPLQLNQAPCFAQKRPHPSSTDIHGIKRCRPYPQPTHPDYNAGFHPECDADFDAFYGPSNEEMEAMLEAQSQW